VDFFEHQEEARRASRRLVLLFVLAVAGTAAAVNLATALGFLVLHLPLPRHLFLTNTALVILFVGGGTLLEIHRLRAGGEVVARMVGGRPIDPGTHAPLERRLLNIVEEMAIAAGLPVPRVYLLDREDGINAFAAGWSVNDAVIGVTRGALCRLDRTELQGVIAHEFSHILNGDMRLNLRLTGVVYGLFMLSMFGRSLIGTNRHSSGRNARESGPNLLALIGLAMWCAGSVGVFFGRWIQAATSRQREFLADASAVQFTRQAEGLGQALRKIAGLAQVHDPFGGLRTGLHHPQAGAIAHMLLSSANRAAASGWLATHPPLAERIARLYGRPMDSLAAPELAVVAEAPPPPLPALEFAEAPQIAQAAPADSTAITVVAAVGQVAPARPRDFALNVEQAHLLAQLRRAAEDASQARSLLLALLLDPAPSTRAQLEGLTRSLGAAECAAIEQRATQIRALPPACRLLLADLASPVLRAWPPAERHALIESAQSLVASDGRVSLEEFLLLTVIKRRLDPAAAAPVDVAYRSVQEVMSPTGLVLSLIAALRCPRAAERAFAPGAAALALPDLPFTAARAIRLPAIVEALEALNRLAPLAKPGVIKAATTIAFFENATDWRTASALRSLAIALDCPLPPRLSALDPD